MYQKTDCSLSGFAVLCQMLKFIGNPGNPCIAAIFCCLLCYFAMMSAFLHWCDIVLAIPHQSYAFQSPKR